MSKPKPVPNKDASGNSWKLNSGGAKKGQKPVPGKTPEKKDGRWHFSFRFWRQIDYFGLGGKDASWFTALLQRLHTLCGESAEELKIDRRKQDVIRYHEVNWNQSNIPLTRDMLNWLPTDIRTNDSEYPLYQFSISTARGRIAGFWDENLFHIVLIDPYHNLQPTEEYNYQTTETVQQLSEHELLLAKLSLIKSGTCNCTEKTCSTQSALQFVDLHNDSFGILYIQGEYYNEAKRLVASGKAKSIEELLQLGVLQLV